MEMKHDIVLFDIRNSFKKDKELQMSCTVLTFNHEVIEHEKTFKSLEEVLKWIKLVLINTKE